VNAERTTVTFHRTINVGKSVFTNNTRRNYRHFYLNQTIFTEIPKIIFVVGSDRKTTIQFTNDLLNSIPIYLNTAGAI